MAIRVLLLKIMHDFPYWSGVAVQVDFDIPAFRDRHVFVSCSFSVMVYSPLLVSLLYACVASMAALTESYSVVPPFCSMVTADSSRRMIS